MWSGTPSSHGVALNGYRFGAPDLRAIASREPAATAARMTSATDPPREPGDPAPVAVSVGGGVTLSSVGKDELRDMAEKDGGAEASCDFCARVYVISAAELLELAAAS